MTVVFALLLAAAPTHQLFEMQTRGGVAGFVELRSEPSRFSYRSVHLFSGGKGPRTRIAEYAVDATGKTKDGFVPAALALWRKPQVGKLTVVDELTGKTGALVIERVTTTQVDGTLFGQAFRASYDKGSLRSIRLQMIELSATGEPPTIATADSPDGSFPVEGKVGALAFRPTVDAPPPGVIHRLPADEAWKTVHQVEGALDDEGVTDCLDRAEAVWRALANDSSSGAFIVVGVHVQADRAFPHAWIRTVDEQGRAHEYDPTLGGRVTPDEYLELWHASNPNQLAPSGALWLSLLRGERTVTRTE